MEFSYEKSKFLPRAVKWTKRKLKIRQKCKIWPPLTHSWISSYNNGYNAIITSTTQHITTRPYVVFNEDIQKYVDCAHSGHAKDANGMRHFWGSKNRHDIFHNPPKGDRREVVPSVGSLRFGWGLCQEKVGFGVSTLCGGFESKF